MFRVYDNIEKCWVSDGIYLSPNDELYSIKRSALGQTKIVKLSKERYIYHKAIDLWDKEGIQVYEGDYIQAQIDEGVSKVGLVAFAHELSSYVILCVDSDEFYTLGSEVKEYISVCGNVFDGY